MHKLPAIFLDRDGTLIDDPGYLHDHNSVVWREGALESLRRLQVTGYALIIVTNQSGIGRGYYTIEEMQAVNQRILDDAREAGIVITDIFYCPHLPEEGCNCRKPNPGMIESALEKYYLDRETSWIFGDKCSDIQAGANARIRTVLIGSGNDCPAIPTHSCPGIVEAVNYVIQSRTDSV